MSPALAPVFGATFPGRVAVMSEGRAMGTVLPHAGETGEKATFDRDQ